jgi:histidinol-phosphate/aromatic aminotransferase/cobyric acid decarboxylase-like protein
VTETDEVAEALDRAAERWPGLSRSQLLVRLVMEADRAAQERLEARRQRRREAIAELSGSLTGVYEPGYLDTLRQDWPE